MSIESAATVWELHQREQVLRETWGHLAPEKDRTYEGRFVYAVQCYNSESPVVLDFDFPGLRDSLWLYEYLEEFIYYLTTGDLGKWPHEDLPLKTEAGCVYEFVGTFRNYKFSGMHNLLYDCRRR
jgi:hypothetical protein